MYLFGLRFRQILVNEINQFPPGGGREISLKTLEMHIFGLKLQEKFAGGGRKIAFKNLSTYLLSVELLFYSLSVKFRNFSATSL